MALRVIWQYMDRSVTKKILYGPQLVYGPVRLQKNIIWFEASDGPYNNFLVTDRSIYSSNNKTLNARLLARVITGCHYT